VEKPSRLVPYLDRAKTESLNKELGRRISEDFKMLLAPDESVLAVVTLKGAMFFGADVLRHVTIPMELDFVRLTSYGAGTSTSGQVRILKDIESSPEGRHVLLLDEIVDSGRTLDFLSSRIRAQAPKSVKIAALLSKPSRREVHVAVDYVGLEVEDKFLVGYGLDLAERYRNLDGIFSMEN